MLLVAVAYYSYVHGAAMPFGAASHLRPSHEMLGPEYQLHPPGNFILFAIGVPAMLPEKSPSVTVGNAAALVDLNKRVLYDAIKDGSLKAWRPWSRGDLRINLDELARWSGRDPNTASAA